jgi:hypothetical protein
MHVSWTKFRLPGWARHAQSVFDSLNTAVAVKLPKICVQYLKTHLHMLFQRALLVLFALLDVFLCCLQRLLCRGFLLHTNNGWQESVSECATRGEELVLLGRSFCLASSMMTKVWLHNPSPYTISVHDANFKEVLRRTSTVLATKAAPFLNWCGEGTTCLHLLLNCLGIYKLLGTFSTKDVITLTWAVPSGSQHVIMS